MLFFWFKPIWSKLRLLPRTKGGFNVFYFPFLLCTPVRKMIHSKTFFPLVSSRELKASSRVFSKKWNIRRPFKGLDRYLWGMFQVSKIYNLLFVPNIDSLLCYFICVLCSLLWYFICVIWMKFALLIVVNLYGWTSM